MDQLNYIPLLKDEHYVLAIKAGGVAGDHAIVNLYTKYHKAVKAAMSDMISLYPGCKTEADDIVHDSFILMLHKIQCEGINSNSPKAFWIGIARKIMLNQVKKNGKIILVEEAEEIYGQADISPETLFLITERNQQIEKYLSIFGNRCKEILLLWMSRYTMGEIADQLQLSGPRMATKLKHSCFKKLRDLVIKGNKFSAEDITG